PRTTLRDRPGVSGETVGPVSLVLLALCHRKGGRPGAVCESARTPGLYFAWRDSNWLRCLYMSSMAISSIPPAAQSAELGIQRGMSGLNRDAQVVADGNIASDTDALTGALVDSLEQKILVEASARMLSTVDKTLGTLIDVKA